VQRPQLGEQRARHAAARAVGFGRLVVDDLVAIRVVADHQPEVLGRVRTVGVVHAHDAWHPAREVGVERRERGVEAGAGAVRIDRGVDVTGQVAEALHRPHQIAGVRAAAEAGIDAGRREHRVLVVAPAQAARRHLDTRLAAEVRPLFDEGDVVEHHGR
jgi:hypothetical protein